MATNLVADDICWSLPKVQMWVSAATVIEAAIALLPEISDDLTADLVEDLAAMLTEASEHVEAIWMNLTAALEQLHIEQREVRRLKARLVELLEARRGIA